MKTIFLLLLLFYSFVSCGKKVAKNIPIVALNVVSSIISGDNIKLNTNQRDSVKPYNAKIFGLLAGNSNITLFPTVNPTKPYYYNTLATEGGAIYSIFLCGRVSNIESVFIQDNIPAYYVDSFIGIRVINLSPNSEPINMTLASNPAINLFSSLAYKQITGFIKLPLTVPISSGSVTFQVRSSTTTSLLTSYVLPTAASATYPGISITLSRFKNITLVIKGLSGLAAGKDAFGLFPITNY